MSPVPPRAPEGYVRFLVRGADVVAASAQADAVRQALISRTLYTYAERHPHRRRYEGRIPAYGVPLPGGATRVVVRHSQHGGLLAPFTGDLFLPPTRAPHELDVALRLRDAGVPTPEIVAYAVYQAGALFRRADVVTREIGDARDLGELLLDAPTGDTRTAVLEAVAALLRTLTQVGARHPDLNVKNILLSTDPSGALRTYVLDVDRITFHTRGGADARVGQANLKRLTRSLRKWRDRRKASVSEEELTWLADASTRGES